MKVFQRIFLNLTSFINVFTSESIYYIANLNMSAHIDTLKKQLPQQKKFNCAGSLTKQLII